MLFNRLETCCIRVLNCNLRTFWLLLLTLNLHKCLVLGVSLHLLVDSWVGRLCDSSIHSSYCWLLSCCTFSIFLMHLILQTNNLHIFPAGTGCRFLDTSSLSHLIWWINQSNPLDCSHQLNIIAWLHWRVTYLLRTIVCPIVCCQNTTLLKYCQRRIWNLSRCSSFPTRFRTWSITRIHILLWCLSYNSYFLTEMTINIGTFARLSDNLDTFLQLCGLESSRVLTIFAVSSREARWTVTIRNSHFSWNPLYEIVYTNHFHLWSWVISALLIYKCSFCWLCSLFIHSLPQHLC